MRTNQQGFGHVLLLVLLVAVAVVGFAAYRVHSAQTKTTTSSTAAPVATATDQLTSSSKELDQANTQLDSSLDDSALNTDLQSM